MDRPGRRVGGEHLGEIVLLDHYVGRQSLLRGLDDPTALSWIASRNAEGAWSLGMTGVIMITPILMDRVHEPL